MKPIKFRCWNKEHKVMNVQGEPDLETLQSFIFHYGDQELMQFTGLYDKNGKEIFEGDIILYTYNEDSVKGKIVFKDLAYQIQIQDIPSVFQRIFSWSGRHIEVVGNIHNNSEFLEQ